MMRNFERCKDSIESFIRKYENDKDFKRLLKVKLIDTLDLISCMWDYSNISEEEFDRIRDYIFYIEDAYKVFK